VARVPGIDQWSPGEVPVAWLERQVAQGQVFVLRRGGELGGTVTVSFEDPLVWGADAGPAGYLHNLIVDRRLEGRGVGRRLLHWAEDCVAAAGLSVVRLDCVAANRRLRDYYESAGFRWVRDERFPKELAMARTTSLYEKRR
jgi:protein-tyrosine phosphatase